MKTNDNKNPITASVEQQLLTEEARTLLMEAGSSNPEEARIAQAKIANCITEELRSQEFGVAAPIREGVLDGDIIGDIFLTEDFTNNGSDMRIPLDFLSPGSENEHVAYVMPHHGKIPDRRVEGDYIQLSAYQIASSIDCTRQYLRNARFDILRRMIEVLRISFVKKNNDDGWQTLLAAVNGRNIVVYDADATAGQFTPKLVSLMKNTMRRNGGGNSTSINRRRLTDLYMSPEALEDMVSWGLNVIPDDIRSAIHRSENGSIMGLYGVNFHDLDELGVGQEYQLYYTDVLGGSLGPSSDEELVVGLDLTNRDKSFLRPVVEELSVFEDNTLHREGLVGFYGMMTNGFAVLDTRYCIAGSF